MYKYRDSQRQFEMLSLNKDKVVTTVHKALYSIENTKTI